LALYTLIYSFFGLSIGVVSAANSESGSAVLASHNQLKSEHKERMGTEHPANSRTSGVRHQQRPNQRQFEQIEAEKIAFITKELALTPKEAQRFFPIYNQYRGEIWEVLGAAQKKMRQEGVRKESRDDVLEREAKILAIKKKYRVEFAPVIG